MSATLDSGQAVTTATQDDLPEMLKDSDRASRDLNEVGVKAETLPDMKEEIKSDPDQKAIDPVPSTNKMTNGETGTVASTSHSAVITRRQAVQFGIFMPILHTPIIIFHKHQ